MLPNFLVIGAQKSGTTTLWKMLDQHPEVFMSPVRETGFFFNEYLYYRGLHFYETEFFSNWNGEKAVGEKTPEYLFSEKAAHRIKESIPESKFVVALRSPAARAHSGYRHTLMMMAENLSFLQALEKEPERISACFAAEARFGYLQRGYYAKQLRPYFDLFSRDQLLILDFSKIVSNYVSSVKKIYEFIGVNSNFSPNRYSEGRPNIEKFLIRDDGSIEIKGNRVKRPSSELMKFAEQFNKTFDSLSSLSRAEEISINKQYFHRDIESLIELTGMDFSHWLGE